jgi:hypothetical protein
MPLYFEGDHKFDDHQSVTGGFKKNLDEEEEKGFSTPYQESKRRKLNPYEAISMSAAKADKTHKVQDSLHRGGISARRKAKSDIKALATGG